MSTVSSDLNTVTDQKSGSETQVETETETDTESETKRKIEDRKEIASLYCLDGTNNNSTMSQTVHEVLNIFYRQESNEKTMKALHKAGLSTNWGLVCIVLRLAVMTNRLGILKEVIEFEEYNDISTEDNLRESFLVVTHLERSRTHYTYYDDLALDFIRHHTQGFSHHFDSVGCDSKSFGCLPSYIQNSCRTLLGFAAYVGNFEAVQYLVQDKKVPVNLYSAAGASPLLECFLGIEMMRRRELPKAIKIFPILRGHLKIARYLLLQGAYQCKLHRDIDKELHAWQLQMSSELEQGKGGLNKDWFQRVRRDQERILLEVEKFPPVQNKVLDAVNTALRLYSSSGEYFDSELGKIIYEYSKEDYSGEGPKFKPIETEGSLKRGLSSVSERLENVLPRNSKIGMLAASAFSSLVGVSSGLMYLYMKCGKRAQSFFEIDLGDRQCRLDHNQGTFNAVIVGAVVPAGLMLFQYGTIKLNKYLEDRQSDKRLVKRDAKITQ